jgi:hypothetical protein
MQKLVCLGVVLCCSALIAQNSSVPLDDQRIVDLVGMGVSQAEILRIIATTPKFSFDLRPVSTDAMMKAGVSEDTIKAMAARQNGQRFESALAIRSATDSVPASRTAAVTGSDTFAVPEVGAYYQSGGRWIQMMPEVVNWQSGGVVKTLATAGVVKPDINGRVQQGRSRTKVPKPIRFLIYTPDGSQVTEYQLIKLRIHSNAREFRTVTGGIFHISGGAKRDDLPFEAQHVAVRTWTVELSELTPGEYGFLPPGAMQAQSASAQLLLRSTKPPTEM